MATRYLVLGQSAPGATTDTNLYTVPAGKDVIISTIVIANRSATAATYRIAVRPAGATVANLHYLAFDAAVLGNDSITMTIGITLTATDVVTVRASTADLSFSVFGSQVDI
jgi:hypothetical protein